MSAAAAAVGVRPGGPTAGPQARPLDRDNPWPGLASYDESARLYFNGRSEEIAELSRRVIDEPLTVLFGRSGLGKSSLLKAGLFPPLREQGFVPVYIRLQLHAQAPPLSAQVRFALEQELRAQSIEAPDWPADESLWQYLHRCDLEFWNTNNRLVQPVLVFDQFEEVFTLGRRLPAEVERFRTELADLIENRVPASLYAQLEATGSKALCLDLKAMPYKVVLSLREDFLADLENWRASIPSLRRNRMRLLPMRTANALQAIHNERTAHLVDEAQARQIVSFLAARTAGDVEPGRALADPALPQDAGDDSEIDPALLSLFCAGVNLRRQRAGRARFDEEAITAAQRTVVADFYRECVADLPPVARAFIEDELVTEQGYRNSFAVDDAIARGYLTEAQLDDLVNRRLLRRAHLLGTERVELTHDLLTKAVVHERDLRVKAEREARQQREQRRVRLWVAGAALAIVASVGLSLWFWRLMNEADQQRNEANLQRQQAWSRQLAAMATREIDRDHELATGLAAQALRLAETEQSRKAFFDTARYSWPYRKLAGVAALGGTPKAIAISNSGRYLAVLADAIDDEAEQKPVFVSLWDIDNEDAEPKRLWIQRASVDDAAHVAVSRERDTPLVAIGGSSAIEWLDHKAGECAFRMAAPGGVNAMAFGGGSRAALDGRRAPFFGWAGDKVHVLASDPRRPETPAAQTGCAGPATDAPADLNTLSVDGAREISFARDGSLLIQRRVTSGQLPALGDNFELRRYLRAADGRYSDREQRPVRLGCATEASLSLGTNRYSTTTAPATCAFQYSDDEGDFAADNQFDPADAPERRWVRNVVWASAGAAHLKVLGDGELEMSGPDAGGRVRVHLRGVDFPAHARFDESLKNELALSGNGQRIAAVGHRGRAVTVYYLEPRPFYAELASGRFAVAPDGRWVVIETERRWREDDSTLTVFAREPGGATYAVAGTIRLPSPLKEMSVQQDALRISLRPNKEAMRDPRQATDRGDGGRRDQRALVIDRELLLAAHAKGEALTIDRSGTTAWDGAGPSKILIGTAAGSGADALTTPATSGTGGSAAATLNAGASPAASAIAEKCGVRPGRDQQLAALSPGWFALWDDSSVELFDITCRDFGRYEIGGVSGVGLAGGETILRIDLANGKRSMMVPLERTVTESVGRQLTPRDYGPELCRIARIDCDRDGTTASSAARR